MSDSQTPPASPDPVINSTVSRLSDFSDRISPMIVKELRQGLRTRTFTGTFLILQTILGFSMLIALTSESGNTGTMISTMVFFLFSIVALILQPLRGTSAVATEMKDDTLEIMSLTRLSSVRIVFGKWASIVSQTALMLAATIPYLVMRYFFGGMQLFAELGLLFTIFFLSVCLTAVTVGFSCSRAVLVRALIPLILIPAGLTTISTFLMGPGTGVLMEVFSFQNKEVNIAFFTWMLVCAYLGYYFLDMGVSRIAAIAENHSVRKRLVSLVLMGVVLAILFFNPPAEIGSVFVLLAFSCAIGIDVCTEMAVCVPSVVKPYVKRGLAGKIAGRFFYPGWHSGVYLLTLLFVLTILIGQFTFREYFGLYYGPVETGLSEEVVLVIVGIFYTIMGPLLITRIFIKKIKDSFTGFIGAVMLSALLTSLVAIFSSMSRSGGEGILYLSSWIPGVWMLFLDRSRLNEEGIVLTGIFLAISWIVLLLMANEEFRNTAKLEKIAKDSLGDDDK